MRMIALVATLLGCGSPTRPPTAPTAPSVPTVPTTIAPAPIPVTSPLVPRGKLPITDFDGDGLGDLAFTAVERPGEQCQQDKHGKTCWRPQQPSRMIVLVFLGRDRGALSQTLELASGPDDLKMGRAYELGAVGDLDGDGRAEVAITFHPANAAGAETLLLLHGTPTGLSGPYQSVPLPKVPSHFWYSMRARPAGDVDGDGFADIALGAAILHGGAHGRIGRVELVQPPNYSPYEFVRTLPVGDVTGDAIADLVAVTRGETYFLPSRGTPTKLALAASWPAAIEAADLDGDGRAELISIAPGGGTLRVEIHALASTGPTRIAAIDVSGDEVHGLVAADTDGSGVRDLHLIASIGRADVPCGTQCSGPANVHVRTVRLGPTTLSLDPKPPAKAILIGAGPHIYLRAFGDLDGDGIEELGIVEDGTLRAARSRGGVFTIDREYSKTPKEIAVYTGAAF